MCRLVPVMDNVIRSDCATSMELCDSFCCRHSNGLLPIGFGERSGYLPRFTDSLIPVPRMFAFASDSKGRTLGGKRLYRWASLLIQNHWSIQNLRIEKRISTMLKF